MKRIIAFLTVIAISMTMGVGGTVDTVYAAVDLSAKHIVGFSAKQGSQIDVTFEVENSGDEVTYYAVLDAGEQITVSRGNGNSGITDTLAQGMKKQMTFTLDIGRTAETTTHTLLLTLYDENDEELATEISSIEVAEPQRGQAAAVDVNYTLSNSAGIIAGAENTLSLEIFNRGNTLIKNMQISLELPDGMSINNAVGYVNAGYLSVASRYRTQFPIVADESMESRNYPVVVKITGMDSGNNEITLEPVLYVPVKSEKVKVSADDLEITKIHLPKQVAGGDEFTLEFEVSNRGVVKLPETKVTVDVPEGLANQTKNVFVLTGLAPGASEKCSVTLSATTKTESEYQLLKITAVMSPGKDQEEVSVSQYAGTMVKNVQTNTKTPQLMVSDYTYGGSYVQAGNEFALNLNLYNTHITEDLQNVKVTLTSEDGTFIPVSSSNSFYIDKIAAKGQVSQTIYLSAKRDAEQKTTSLTIDMSYEDTAGNPFTAKDVISIPIMQETRLVVDDLIAPPELYAGMQTGVSVDFYNMGKTILNNLRVNVEGDFDAPQSNLYYVGNMEPGKSDSYDFSFIPRQAGPMAGVITFTYEDASGVEQSYEQAFAFEVTEEAVWEDMGMMEPVAEETGIPWLPIVVGALVVASIVGIALWRRHRKRKLNQEMEIDE